MIEMCICVCTIQQYYIIPFTRLVFNEKLKRIVVKRTHADDCKFMKIMISIYEHFKKLFITNHVSKHDWLQSTLFNTSQLLILHFHFIFLFCFFINTFVCHHRLSCRFVCTTIIQISSIKYHFTE